ncbi:MAG: OmpA family protein [Myxococcota bacterium]
MSANRAALLLVCMFPVLMAANCRDRTRDVDIIGADPTPPTIKLQITSLDPDRAPAQKGFRTRVLGSNFQDGARVMIGDREVTTIYGSDNVVTASVPPLDAGGYDVQVTNPDGEVAILRGGLVITADTSATAASNCDDLKVYFPLDSSKLDDAAMRALAATNGCVSGPSAAVRVEGHCDDRGTIDYNIALGQRRAEAVKRYLVSQGIAPTNIRTVSYGEERPAVEGNNESAWQQNRRAEIRFRE